MVAESSAGDAPDAHAAIRPAWLAELFFALLAAALADTDTGSGSLALPIDIALRWTDGMDGTIPGADEALRESTHLRRALFWRQVARRRATGKTYPRRWWEVHPIGLLAPSAADRDWLAQDAITAPSVRDRLLAFDYLLAISPKSDDVDVETVESVAARADALHGDDSLEKHLRRARNQPTPPARPRFDLSRRARELRDLRQRERDSAALHAAIESIREGKNEQALRYLHGIGNTGSSLARYAAFSERAVAEVHGAEIAAAACEGFKQYWRDHEATLVHEWAERNRTPCSAIFGLVGITLDVEDGLDITTLSEGLLRRAAAYGLWEINGFPPWFATIAEHRAEVVRDASAPALARDFTEPPAAGRDALGVLVWKLSNAPAPVAAACAPVLLESLRAGDPVSLAVLRDALYVLLTRQYRPQVLAEVAATRCRSCVAQPERFSMWWSTLATLDATAAVDELELLLPKAESPKLLVEQMCACAWEDRDGRRTVASDALRADGPALERLIPIVFSHVRHEDDLHHDGVFSPGRRDHAQDFRNSLLSWASAASGVDAEAGLRRLSEHPSLRDVRSWLLHLADEAAAGSYRLLSESEAVAFIDRFVRVPTTTADLFELALARLTEIADDIQTGDFSVRRAYCPDKEPVEEEDAQLLLADKLNERRREQYSVSREPEVTRKNRPDIRLQNPQCDGPVTIELKIAERWTGPELEDAISSQLVDKYMKANNSSYGVLVVCSSGPVRAWQPRASSKVGFDGLVAHLRVVAERVAAERNEVSRLEVVAIDFH